MIEGSLKPVDVNAYGKSVKIISYNDVIRLGEKSSQSFCPPKPDDIAIIMVNFIQFFNIVKTKIPNTFYIL